MITRHPSRRSVLAIAVALASFPLLAQADDLTYLGGNWNSPSSWSAGHVPTADDYLFLPANRAGTVQLNGGGVAQEVRLEGGASGYNFVGEAGARLRVGHYINDGDDTNAISVAQLTGLDLDAEHSRLVIDGGAETQINSQIVNDESRSTEVWARAVFHNFGLNSGATHFLGNSRLADNGAFLVSNTLFLDRASVTLDNTGPTINGDRFYDGATLTMRAGALRMDGTGIDTATNHERINAIDLGPGSSRVELYGMASLRTASLGMTRDNNARGTLVITTDTEDTFKTKPSGMIGDLVPYAIYSNQGYDYGPAIYDPGVDGVAGNSDDGGFHGADYENNINLAGTSSHLLIWNGGTLPSDRTVRTLTIDDNERFNLGTSRITLSDGVMIMRSGGSGASSSLYGAINAMLIAGPGRELFIYGGGQENEIAVPISGGNGITFTPTSGSVFDSNKLVLSSPNQYAGPTTINSGWLALRNAQALPTTSTLRLVEGSVDFDFTPTASIGNRIVFDTGSAGPFGDFSFIRDIKLKAGQTFTFTGSIEGKGAYFVRGEGSMMKVDTGSNVTALNSGDYSLWPQGTVTLRVDGQLGDGANTRGSVILFEGSLVGKGRLTGGFQLSGGTFAPGSSGAAGTALFRVADAGLYEGEARFNINGTARGTQYDALDVDNNLFTNEKTHFIVEPSSFVGQFGQTFDLVKYSTHYAFGAETVTVPLATVANGQWVHYFDDDSFTIAVAGPSGDANLDGKVGFSDLVLLAQHYNQNGNWRTGDFNYDGVINFSDLVTLAQHYTGGAGSLTGVDASFRQDWALAQAVAPEPTTFAAISGLAIAAMRRRTGGRPKARA